MVTHKNKYSHILFVSENYVCVYINVCLHSSVQLCVLIKNIYGDIINLNLFEPVHKKVRRQLLYYLYSDNICVFFHIHIFHAV